MIQVEDLTRILDECLGVSMKHNSVRCRDNFHVSKRMSRRRNKLSRIGLTDGRTKSRENSPIQICQANAPNCPGDIPGLYPHPNLFCPICFNRCFPNLFWDSRQSVRHPASSKSFPGMLYSPEIPCWGPKVQDARVSRYKGFTGLLDSNQWGKSINITMNSKDYKKVCPSIPEFARFLLVALLMATLPLTSAMSPPPNYSQSNMPTTNFTCSDKATGGYYADPEAGCQMFHVCVRISEDEMNDFRFLCPNDTVFDQQNFICTNWWEIDCERSTRYYSKNDLFRVGDPPPEYEYENPETPVYYEYVYEYVDADGVATSTSKTVEKATEAAFENRHRLSFGKSKSEKAEARAIETANVHTSTNPSKVTKQYRRPVGTSPDNKKITTTSTTTPRPTPKITTHEPLHRVSLVPFTTRVTSTSTVQPSFQLKGFTSRGGSALLNQSELEEETNSKNKKQKKLELDSDNPYANFEWKKDSKGVTASARTRYEALFGTTSSRGRDFIRREDKNETSVNKRTSGDEGKAASTPETPNQKRKQTESQIQRQKQRQRKNLETDQENSQQRQEPEKQEQPQARQRNSRQKQSRTKEPQTSTDDGKHKFSNFRFYKTAFGRSYSSDDFLEDDKRHSPHVRVSDPVRLERTASRNTRYSIYG